MRRALAGLVGLLVLLGACDEATQAPPPPSALTRDAVGYYSGMIVEDRDGPKGQILLADRSEPLWFSSVRDTIAFTMLPEEPDDIAAIYVHDMGKVANWAHPGDDAWMDARVAHYVIGSSRRGGMGAPEAVPFSRKEDAEAFVRSYGGKAVPIADIPRDYILGDVGAKGAWEEPRGGPEAHGKATDHNPSRPPGERVEHD